MKMVIGNIAQFKVFFDVVYDTASDLIELQFYPDRLTCSLMDRGHTRYFNVVYDDDFFEYYNIDDVESVTLFMADLHKLLKSCNNKDTLTLEVNDDYLIAKIESENGNSRIFEFVLPVDFISSPAPPRIELPTAFECGAGDIAQSIKDIKLIGSDIFVFVADNDTLTLMTDADISTRYANTLNIDYDRQSGAVSSRFNRDYIEQMLKFKNINDTVKLQLGDTQPLIYSFKDELMGVTVNGLIAPLLKEEE